MIAIVVVQFVLAVVFVGSSFLMRSDDFDRNDYVGVRTRTMSASDEAWRRGQRAAAAWVLAGGVIMAAFATVGLALSLAGDASDGVTGVVGVGGVVALAVPLLASGVVANRAARSGQ